MAQVGLGKSAVEQGGPPPEELKPMSSSQTQRTQREDLYYGPQPNGLHRGISMASPANSLGTESLVTPNTTPEPSGSPRNLESEPIVLPPPTASTTYDRYMQSPPMMQPFMAYPYYPQPTVYLVHPSMHQYMSHPMDPVPIPYDFSVPPPNINYMPMGSHIYPPQHVYKMPSADRYVPYEHATMAHHTMPHQSNDMLLATSQRAETPIPDTTEDETNYDQIDHLPTDEEPNDVGLIAELIEEVHIATLNEPQVENPQQPNTWYESVADNEQHQESGTIEVNGELLVVSTEPVQQSEELDEQMIKRDERVTPNHVTATNNCGGNINNNIPSRYEHQPYRDNQRYPSKNRRNGRELSGNRYDYDRRSATPERRNRGGSNNNFRNIPRDDRRYSNPEHGATHLRARRSREFDNQPNQTREPSAGRRDNRQRYYASPRRDEDYRYDGSVRRSGSYRNNWRDDSNGNREDYPKPIPRGRPEKERGDYSHRNRRPPIPRQEQPQPSGGINRASRSRAPHEDELEFLMPSVLGITDNNGDIQKMISSPGVSVGNNNTASQKPPRHMVQGQFTEEQVKARGQQQQQLD